MNISFCFTAGGRQVIQLGTWMKNIIPMHFIQVTFFESSKDSKNYTSVLPTLYMVDTKFQFTRGGCEMIISLLLFPYFKFVSIFQIKTMLHKHAKEKDPLHLCSLLIILRCLIWVEFSNSWRAWKNCCSTRLTVNKGENRKTDLFAQQCEFKELYGVCILHKIQVGRKTKHCTCT